MPFLPPKQQHQSTEGIITAVNNNNNYCKILNSLKHLVRTTVAESHKHKLKQQISKRRYYLAAHRRLVNVLLSNSAFLIFAVLVVRFSHSRPYEMF